MWRFCENRTFRHIAVIKFGTAPVDLAAAGNGDVFAVGAGDQALAASLRRNGIESGMTEIVITLRRRKTENLRSAGNMQLNIASEIDRSGRIDSRLQRNPAAACAALSIAC